MGDGFYMFLPSDSSKGMFPRNTPGHYFTHLAQEVLLDGRWECGLKEIHFSHDWPNLEGNEAIVAYKGQHGNTWNNSSLPEGFYQSPAQLAEALHVILIHAGGSAQYDHLEQKFKLKIAQGAEVIINHSLSKMIGFQRRLNHLTGGTHASTRAINLTRGVDDMYVYADFVKHIYVGDAAVPLLQIVPLYYGDEGRQHREYIKPLYVPVCKSAFRTVEVDIRDGAGRAIPFSKGKTTLLLHFRRCRSTA